MFLRASLSVCVHKLSVSSLALTARFEFHSDLCFPNSTQLLLLFSCLPACFSAAGVKLLFSVGFWAAVVAKGGTHFSTEALACGWKATSFRGLRLCMVRALQDEHGGTNC